MKSEFSASSQDLISEDCLVDEKEITISSNYEIAVWKDFAKAAISHTWDDNTSKQLTVALPLYDSYNFKTTFFTVSSWSPNWEFLKAAMLNGHEIASHSHTHARFDKLTQQQVGNELEDSKKMINTSLSARVCLTYAYSNCVTENYGLTQKYYIAARDCDEQIESRTPTDFMKISSFLCGSESGNKTGESFNVIAKKALKENGWAVYLFHGVDNDGGYSSTNSTELKKHLQFLNANRQTYWVDSFVNVVKYIKERDAVVVNQLTLTSNLITVELTDNLDDTIYNYALSVKKEIPSSWSSIDVKQNNETVNFSLEKEGSKQYVIFEAIPDRGVVKIEKV